MVLYDLLYSHHRTLKKDMREEIQARFDAALEDGKDELDVYSEMLETGIDIKMVRKYLGDDAADHMKDFCKEHGLI